MFFNKKLRTGCHGEIRLNLIQAIKTYFNVPISHLQYYMLLKPPSLKNTGLGPSTESIAPIFFSVSPNDAILLYNTCNVP